MAKNDLKRTKPKLYNENPYDRYYFVGTRAKYIPVEGLHGVTEEAEMVRDTVYIKREEKYDKKKFAKFYIDQIDCLTQLKKNGYIMLWYMLSQIETGKTHVWLIWTDEQQINRSAFSRGIAELCDADILARSNQLGKYWINRNVINRG